MTAQTHRHEPSTCTGSALRWLALWAFLALSLVTPAAHAQTNWTVVGWNNLGMHCMDADFSVFCILPPYNVVDAQTVSAAGGLVGGDAGVTVTYQAVADPSGSINTTSIGKGNFWDNAQRLFGVALPPDVGLPVPGPNSYAMPGSKNTPQAMGYDAAAGWFGAPGIPITPTDDAGRTNRYPMMRLVAKNGATVVATTDIVLPVSEEMNCRACHGSNAGPAAQPADGWVNDPKPERDYRLNVLRLHDDRQLGTPAFAAALSAIGYNAAGLYATVVSDGNPILCAACHRSEALPGSGRAGIPPLTASIHDLHGSVVDPSNGLLLDSDSHRTSCYYCHPGQATRCLRGVMGSAVDAQGALAMQCQSCHGSMSQVGAANRTGWLDEPNCQACHSGDASANAGQIRYTSVFQSANTMRVPTNQRFATTPNAPATGYSLYRFSRGHGGLYCEACHGSTHAEYPSIHANDNIASMQRQGHVGPLVECEACHGTAPSTTTGGPHGLHPLGQTWVSRHQSAGGAQCQACHGTDYRGTVLSRSRADRTLSALGTKNFWRGYQIGCYTCHNGPGGSGTALAPAVVTSRTATTTMGKSVAIPLSATGSTGSTLTLRVVSQSVHGTVGLIGTVATYFPDPGYTGTDSFTFAAWNGANDSNLGTVTITVGTSSGCTYSLGSTSASVGASAGNSSVSVVTAAGCTWTAVPNASWLTISSGASGNGPGSVAYSFAANTGTASRSGTLTIAGVTFTVTQAGTGPTACTYAITPTSSSVGAGLGSGSVTVNTGAGCAWTANANVPWLTITAGASGSGPGTVVFTIAANTQTSSRSGTLTVAGMTFTVTQAGAGPAPCTYSIAPTSASLGAGATNGSIAVSAGSSCAWTANSGSSWITITSGASGSGNGTVRYAVTANTSGGTRNGVISIAGLSFVVTQSGGDTCTYTLTPTSASVPAATSTNTVRVTTGGSCRWTARSSSSWLTILSGSSGTGNGTVRYRVARNTSSSRRTGTLAIAGRTFTVYQASAYSGEHGSAFGAVDLAEMAGRERVTAELILKSATEDAPLKAQPSVYLSDDGVKKSSSLLLWSRKAEVAAGESRLQKFRITLPGGVSARGKYLVADLGSPNVLTPADDTVIVYGPIE